MRLYEHANKTVATKGNPVDQSLCKNFSQLIHEYQVCKTVPSVVESQKRSTYNEKSVE